MSLYTPPVFLGNTLLFVIFNCSKNWFLGIGKFHILSTILQINGVWFRHYRSHCICPSGNPYYGTSANDAYYYAYVTPRFPVLPDWRIRTEFGVRDYILGLFTGFFFFYNIIKISDTYTKELPPEWCPSKSIHIY